ncbi:AraC family transcriptional regulator [Streptococcus gallolyticus]|uniref:AraC family transcriptional regulator n=1 Tax=Streptococcus gallolyticus TaxID=315405 RepID=UPI0022836DE3|nr:helix-turn-helix domain-containing protein [Streptococcus gallolyticus]MCY7184283.1 helix-turn-helix domain-containing protein [Streptococcus gallolyticus subsp. gallolyticus]MCY7190502.1 helix-turn-helix domain-containing protein [Streptococcus gallolyticus subsp. gallolyticus]
MNLETFLLKETEHEKQQKSLGFIPDLKDTQIIDGIMQLPNALFFNNKDIYISKHNRYADYPEHSHQFLELNFMFKGTCHQVINGKDFTLQEGDILLMDSGSRHSISALEKEDILINILFQNSNVSLEWLTQLQGQNSLIYQLLLANSTTHHHSNYLILSTKNNKHVQHIIQQMMTEYFMPHDFSQQIISQYLPILFYELARNLRQIDHSQKIELEETPYLQVLRLIDKDYQDLTLASLAQELNFNKNYLSNLIKEKSGKTFTELITQQKLMKAKLLLQSTRMPIYEIAQSVGFSNKTYFYDKYRAYFGHSPRDDRQV